MSDDRFDGFIEGESHESGCHQRARLSCGCWSEWIDIASPRWERPDEPLRCAVHGQRQFEPFVQLFLMQDESDS